MPLNRHSPGIQPTERRAWQLPRGVSAGTWDYVDQSAIATQYDAFHGAHPLMQLDVRILQQELDRVSQTSSTPLLIADLGCGTARVARYFTDQPFQWLNVDLSQHMLSTAINACAHSQSDIADRETVPASSKHSWVRSNLVELDWLADHSLDAAVCLFSSIGMIRGRENRIAFLTHVRRVLKPGGFLLLHVHNRGHSWLDPQGPWWLLSTWFQSLLAKSWQYGDRVYVYRGLPQMYLHIYSRSELQSELRQAGFESVTLMPIDLHGADLYRGSRMLEYIRAGGYFALGKPSPY